MKDAIKNFALVTAGILLCVFAAWIYLRGKGLSEPVKPPLKHAFLESPVTVVAYRGEGPPNSLEALDRAAALGPEIVLWVDIGPNPSGKLVALDQALAPTPVMLSEILGRYPNHRLILNFQQNRPGFLPELIADVDAAKAGDRILVQSPEDGILRELREKRPLWLYGSSQARAVQMRMLASFGLESMAPLKGDVFVVDWGQEREKLRGLSDAIINEVHRREMKILAGPVDSKEEADALRARGVDGILTTRPSTFVDQAHR